MRFYFLVTLVAISFCASAQHCPWDCTGFLMLKTDASKAEMEKMYPVLVDANRQPIIDTLHGTGKATYDSCVFLEYEDFVKYRTERTKLHQWYEFDTVLKFAKDHYVVHYNFCKYSGQQLFIRYMGPGHGHYHFMEIPEAKRIHLHNYNTQLRDKDHEAILKDVAPNIITVTRAQWGL